MAFFSKAAPRLGPSLLCVAAGATALHLSSHDATGPARCEVPLASQPPRPATSVAVMSLRRWLEQQGADVAAVDFKMSLTDADRFGLFANPDGLRRKAARGVWGALKAAVGLGRNANVPLASFPLGSVLTAGSVLRGGGQQAGILRELAELGVADERTVVILHLLVERLRGRDSKLCPWINLLPQTFGTTLFFSDQELRWLEGTTLHKATMLRQQALQEQWRRLEPACRQLALSEGVEQAPTLQDFLWAYSIFWSRTMSLPMPTEDGRVGTEEGIVPGLDFANHAAGSAARWTVFGAADKPGKVPTHVTLICPRKQLPRPGQEITISYGDKNNEELLFLYGFALKDNPDDVVMVACPIPSAGEWDEKMRDRMHLLALRRLRPQLFLPAPFLRAAQAQQSGGGTGGRRWWWRGGGAGGRGADGALAAAGGGSGLGADLPEGVFDALEVFVMEPRQVKEELARLEGGTAAAGESRVQQGRGELSAAERCGQRMAVLSTLVRLLELKVVTQEGEAGTGPLERDQALLEAAEGAGAGAAMLSAAERHALYYRMGQKRLAREYLLYARGLLEKEMRQMRLLMGPENAE